MRVTLIRCYVNSNDDGPVWHSLYSNPPTGHSLEKCNTAMNRTSHITLCTIAFTALITIPCPAADVYDFALLPADGVISGDAGSTIGWGYSLTNRSSDKWLVTTGLSADPFIASQSKSLFDFPDLAPGT